MKKVLLVLSFALIAALALSACGTADDRALTDAERTATAEAAFGVDTDPVDPIDPVVPVEPVEPVPAEPEPIDPPPAVDVELTPTPDAVVVDDDDMDVVDLDDEELNEMYRLSKILDWDVRDQAGEEVGEVTGFVVDRGTGFIHYVLIDAEGDLEVDGDALALPWNALTVSHIEYRTLAVVDNDNDVNDNDADAVVIADEDPHFVLNVDRGVLASAPVIVDLDVVDFNDPTWRDEYVAFWNTELASVPVTGEMQAGELQDGIFLDDVTGYDVYNTEDDQIADVAEMVVNPETGEITHIVVSVGGFLGAGDRYVPIPFSAFDYDAEEEHFILQATEEELENAPGFDSLDDILFNQPNWADEYTTFWGGFQTVEPTPAP